MTKILFFMPDNISVQNAGNVYRVLGLLEYFKEKQIQVDFVSEISWGKWNDSDLELLKSKNIVSRIFLFNRKRSKKNIIYYFLFHKCYEFFYSLFDRSKGLADFTTSKLIKEFNSLLSTNKYDYIFINYVTWAGLIDRENIPKETLTIIDTHDFITAQHYENCQKGMGKAFEEEIHRLRKFDYIWSISTDEQYIYSQFIPNKVIWVPAIVNNPPIKPSMHSEIFDLVYVASLNHHNSLSIHWFFEKVYPLLPSTITICIVGKINEHLTVDFPNVQKITFANDLHEIYYKSRIAICPMLSGTGLKIKVVEAMSFALPVVCNERGIDGLPNKHENGCLVANEPKLFANNILSLLQDKELYLKQKKLSYQSYENFFSKKAVYDKLDYFFKRIDK